MALLNKLFFPTPTSAPTTLTAASSAPTSQSTPTSSSSATSGSTAGSSSGAWTSSSSSFMNSSRQNNNNQSVYSKNYLSQFPFDGRQIRVLLYRECDSRGRRLLFDSNALEKVTLREADNSGKVSTKDGIFAGGIKHSHGDNCKNDNTSSNNKERKSASSSNRTNSNSFIEVCDEFGYKHNRPNSTDITSIGEMVFGALAMSFRGTALKVHWLEGPSRILCSQVFLTPVGATNSCSSSGGGVGAQMACSSTISGKSLATPRTSISSEYGSIDGLSMNSFSMPFSVTVGRHLSLTPSDPSSITYPVDVPDQSAVSYTSDNTGGGSGGGARRGSSGPRYSSTYSTITDSGYSGISRVGQMSNDQWSNSYQYSVRSSLGSLLSSEQSDPQRKFSIDSSSYFPTAPCLFDNCASDGNLQRRISRNLRTSFENEHSINDFIGFITDNYSTSGRAANNGGSEGGCMALPNYRRASYDTNETRSNPEIGKRRDMLSLKSIARRPKLGLAVCITMSESFEDEMDLFCSEHIALLESMLSRLRIKTECAYINHKDFLQIMYQAWQQTQQWFNDLFTAPRIKCPAWLSITTSGSKYSKNVAERFMRELCWLLSSADTKSTNFFISTMLTAILTHHLGWVSTMSAFNSSSQSHEASVAAIQQRAKLLKVAQKHPYNALWAQMGDLYGAIGMPPKLTRTIIYGTEKLSVERLLNILTYFIRCGEVRRSTKREDFHKDAVNAIIKQSTTEKMTKASNTSCSLSGMRNADYKKSFASGSLTRSRSSKQNLNSLADQYDCEDYQSWTGDEAYMEQTHKMNEIPNVLAFRDSRFVQQELRIGNYLMDTGIEKNSLLGQKSKQLKDERCIRLTVTTPDNVEVCVEEPEPASSAVIDDGVVEAIEIDATTTMTTIGEQTKRKRSLWNMVPQSVRDGLSINDLQKLQDGVKQINRKLDGRTTSSAASQSTLATDSPDGDGGGGGGDEEEAKPCLSHLSLSDLITQNSIGKSDRMTWGIEPIKENVCLEEQIHFDFCQKLIEREHGICRNNDNSSDVSRIDTVDGSHGGGGGGGVVFVLGDNEPLVNLKKSTEDLAEELMLPKAEVEVDNNSSSCQTLCTLHQRTHGPPTTSKKHSGVKFNFEQFPQIATNYMKSKNLVLSNYDLLMDKCTKFETQQQEEEEHVNSDVGDATQTDTTKTSTSTIVSTSSCVVCNTALNSYQTPSNATELEFETDDIHNYPTNSTVSDGGSESMAIIHREASQVSVSTLKSSLSDEKEAISTSTSTNMIGLPTKKPCNNTKLTRSTASTSSDSLVDLLNLPLPGVKESAQDEELPDDMKLHAGFVPSLFFNVSDHYIPDVVLQGTCEPPDKWEINLQEDLALAARAASLISLTTENIAIVADMEKWDVRLISSQSQCFPYNGSLSAPVGMSQLVSSMLETVQAMNNSGISAYECLAFLESKMQEIYLQSETLAAFLLETDFCSLSAITTALNLAENDVPLLLSIASIHTPQISKKYGISFR